MKRASGVIIVVGWKRLRTSSVSRTKVSKAAAASTERTNRTSPVGRRKRSATTSAAIEMP